jgi:hypothetical protein
MGPISKGPVVCPESQQLITNLLYVSYRKSDDLIYTATEVNYYL